MGEFGFFGELSEQRRIANNPGAPLVPPLLAGSFQQLNAGVITRSGYMFCIYLRTTAVRDCRRPSPTTPTSMLTSQSRSGVHTPGRRRECRSECLLHQSER